MERLVSFLISCSVFWCDLSVIFQRMRSEIPLSPEQLESVFDSLDVEGNGFLTIEQFLSGFGKLESSESWNAEKLVGYTEYVRFFFSLFRRVPAFEERPFARRSVLHGRGRLWRRDAKSCRRR